MPHASWSDDAVDGELAGPLESAYRGTRLGAEDSVDSKTSPVLEPYTEKSTCPSGL